MVKWVEKLLAGENGLLSSSETAFILSVVTLCFCTILTAFYKDVTALLGMAGILAGQTGTTKVWKKVSDNSVLKAKENPEPVVPEPQQGININVGASQDPKSDPPILVPDAKEIIIKREGVKMTGEE